MYKISKSAVFFLLLRHIANDYDEVDRKNNRENGAGVCTQHALFRDVGQSGSATTDAGQL